MTLAETERAALADLFDEVGPDRPTLCEGWLTSDLLGHLLIRERRPDATLARMTPLKGWAQRVADGYLADGWTAAVQLFRSGPQRFSPLRAEKIDSALNGGEYFIHHEDVRRGEPGWEPRDLNPEATATLAGLLSSAVVRIGLGKTGVGVLGVLPNGTRLKLRPGDPLAVVTGPAPEIVLWTSGRSAVRLELTGEPAAVQALQDKGFGVD